MDATVFASLLFGGLFLLVVAPNWEPISPLDLPVWAGLLALFASGIGMASSWLARWANGHGGPAGILLIAATMAQTIGAAALIVMMVVVPEPTGHARQAVILVTLGYAALHCCVGALMAGHGIWRMRQGFVSARRSTELSLAWLWNFYATATVVLALGLTMLLGMIGEMP